MNSQDILNDKGEVLKAGCLVINDNKEILLVSKIEEDIWTFPKGHLEAGESVEKTAVREVEEETGYEVELIKRLHDMVYMNLNKNEPTCLALFVAKPKSKVGSGELQTKSKWFKLEEAKKSIYHKLAYVLDEV